MAKLIVEIPEDLITSLNELADKSGVPTNELIKDVFEKMVNDFREYMIALNRLNDDSGNFRDFPPKVQHLPKIKISQSFKIIES